MASAENKTQPTDAAVVDYIQALPTERRREEGEAGQERRAGEAAGRHASPFFFPGTGSPIFRRTCWRSSQASFFLSGWRRRKDGW